MAYTNNVLKTTGVVALTSGVATVYTVPVSTFFTVAMLHLANTSGSAATVRIYLVPNAGSPSAANGIVWDLSIDANDVLEMMKGDIWTAGDTIQALCSPTGAVTLKLGGIETS